MIRISHRGGAEAVEQNFDIRISKFEFSLRSLCLYGDERCGKCLFTESAKECKKKRRAQQGLKGGTFLGKRSVKRALITGITRQDGSYLADLLLTRFRKSIVGYF